MFDDWKTSTNENGGSFFKKAGLRAAQLDASALKGEEAGFATSVIYAAGEAFDSDFYSSWNGEADVRLYSEGDCGILAVMSMARPGDEMGPEDSPTFAWKKEGDSLWLVGSRKWRDTKPADLLGIEWPAKAQFKALSGVQGWGE